MKTLFWISALAAACAFGQRQITPFVLPDDVAPRKVDILSEGTHGWGGTVAGLRRDAAAFAQARSWL
jgi:hypothetical protein